MGEQQLIGLRQGEAVRYGEKYNAVPPVPRIKRAKLRHAQQLLSIVNAKGKAQCKLNGGIPRGGAQAGKKLITLGWVYGASREQLRACKSAFLQLFFQKFAQVNAYVYTVGVVVKVRIYVVCVEQRVAKPFCCRTHLQITTIYIIIK